MPTTIASVIAFCASTYAAEELRHGEQAAERRNEELYTYGRFVGTDGRTHVGIERASRALLLGVRNPDVRRRRWAGVLGRKDEDGRGWI